MLTAYISCMCRKTRLKSVGNLAYGRTNKLLARAFSLVRTTTIMNNPGTTLRFQYVILAIYFTLLHGINARGKTSDWLDPNPFCLCTVSDKNIRIKPLCAYYPWPKSTHIWLAFSKTVLHRYDCSYQQKLTQFLYWQRPESVRLWLVSPRRWESLMISLHHRTHSSIKISLAQKRWWNRTVRNIFGSFTYFKTASSRCVKDFLVIAMSISAETLIAIIGLFIALPPSLLILWRIVRRRNRYATNLGKTIPFNAGQLAGIWCISTNRSKSISKSAQRSLHIDPSGNCICYRSGY